MQLPIVLALALCDDVWVDPNSRKQSILGMYGSIASPVFPHVAPQISVYVCLTECPPAVSVRVKIIDVDEERDAIIDVEQTTQSPDLRATIQGTIRVKDVTFPIPGEYRIQLFANDEILLERRLALVQIGGPQ